jgi:hypothetical protein
LHISVVFQAIARRAPAALVLVICAAAGDAAGSGCGLPLSSGSLPRTNDCLYILKAAVQLASCELCICDTDGNAFLAATDAQRCLRSAVGLGDALSCPDCAVTTTTAEETSTTSTPPPTSTTTSTNTSTTTSTTTTTFGGRNPACPGSVEWTTHAGYGATCEDNADCAAGVCDHASGRCRTETRWDVGWTGSGHNTDLDEGALERVKVECEAESAPCGECEVVGIDPSLGNCRCANDTRTACSRPFETNSTECPSCSGGSSNSKPCASDLDCPAGACSGAALCQCFASPPVPVMAGSVPFCFLPRFGSDVSGTIDVDTGESSLPMSLRLFSYLGLSYQVPCPVCGGVCTNDASKFCVRDEDCTAGATCNDDPIANDGLRAGVCAFGPLFNDYLGPDKAKPCDNGAYNASFPAFASGPSGGWYSLDCLPDGSTNSTGSGLQLSFVRTTGSVSLGATVSCGGAASGMKCPCRLCSNDAKTACNTDEECVELPAESTCTLGTGSGAAHCTSNEDCVSADGGTCVSFSDQQRCRYASSVGCNSNSDCQNLDLGGCRRPTCSSNGGGTETLPNSCENGACSDTGSGIGECTAGPDEKFCAGLVEASGDGIRGCQSDQDCEPPNFPFDARPCSLVQRRRCFLDPIEATGSADPARPVLAEAWCMGTMNTIGKNGTFGLPGPARVTRQTSLRAYCDSNSATLYAPGIGGCEP